MTLWEWLKGRPEEHQREGFTNTFGQYLQYEDKPHFTLAFGRIFTIIGTIAPISVMVYAFWP